VQPVRWNYVFGEINFYRENVVCEIRENHPTTSINSDSEANDLVNHLNEHGEIPNRFKLHF
jgi:hypothetical protein